MKQKTSVTLSKEVVRAIDRVAGKTANRSQFIEKAVIFFLAAHAKKAREQKDRLIYEAKLDPLSVEALDALGYQADW